MEWLQVLILFLANASLIFWFRSESRADWRHMDNKLDAFREAIREDMKDFHERLLKQDFEFKSRLEKIEEGRK
jgi:hypothetical protein